METNHTLSTQPTPAIAEPLRTITRAGTTFVPARHGSYYYDELLWRLKPQIDLSEESSFLLGLVGCERGSGTSTIAANLAIRAADQHFGPVLLVDANFPRPKLHKMLRTKNDAGLIECWAAGLPLNQAVQKTSIAGLEFLSAGNPASLKKSGLDHEFMNGFLNEMREGYPLVIFDLPMASEIGAMLPLAQMVSAGLLVLHAETVHQSSAQRVVSRLTADRIPLMGVVLSQKKSDWLSQ